MLDDFSISAKQRLETFCIEQQPGLGLTADNLNFSVPRKGVFTDKNTEVTVSYRNTLVHVPTRVIHFNRVNIGKYFADTYDQNLPLNTTPNLESVLAAIMSQYDVSITDEDISLSIGAGTVTLMSNNNSYGWVGSVTFVTAGGNFNLDDENPLQLDDDETFRLDDDTFFELDDDNG